MLIRCPLVPCLTHGAWGFSLYNAIADRLIPEKWSGTPPAAILFLYRFNETTIMSNSLIVIDGVQIRRDSYGRYSLNDLHKAAMANGKATENHAPAQFLRNDSVKAFISAVDAESLGSVQKRTLPTAESLGDVQKRTSVHSVKGGKTQGTWADELVAIRYAAWINPTFEVRVYRTFRDVTLARNAWMEERQRTVASHQSQSDMLKLTRELVGKDTEEHHYVNEANLINWVAFRVKGKMNRDGFAPFALKLLHKLQLRNTLLIAQGVPYAERKKILDEYAWEVRIAESTRDGTAYI